MHIFSNIIQAYKVKLYLFFSSGEIEHIINIKSSKLLLVRYIIFLEFCYEYVDTYRIDDKTYIFVAERIRSLTEKLMELLE